MAARKSLGPPVSAEPDPLAAARDLLWRIEPEEVRERFHRVLVLWEMDYRREALSQFRLTAERALQRLLDADPHGAVDDGQRARQQQRLDRGQCAKVIEWLYRKAERVPARIALHLHTLLGWGNYGSHHQARGHRAQTSDLGVLLSISLDLEEWLAVTLDGKQGILADAALGVEGERTVLFVAGAGLDPEVARVLVSAAGGVAVAGSSNLAAPTLGLELHFAPPCPNQGDHGYRGLQPFGPEDAGVFFGRDALLERLQQTLQTHDLVLLCGASGAGKTSLLRAGLLPLALGTGLNEDEQVQVNNNNISNLTVKPVSEDSHRLAVLTLCEYSEASLGAAVQLMRAWPAGRPLLLIFDQLERGLLQQVPAEVRRLLLEILLRVERWPKIRLVVGLREDFLGRLLREARQLDGERAATLLRGGGLLTVGPLSPEAARQAIVRPLEGSGIRLDPALVDRVLLPELSSDGGAPPAHLQLVCGRLLDEARRRDVTLIDRDLHRELGGTSRILETYLDQVLSAPRYEQDRDAARTLLKAMAGGEIRRWVDPGGLWQALGTAGRSLDEVELRSLLSRLLDDRLVASRHSGPGRRGAGPPEYSLMHDLLAEPVRHWRSAVELERQRAQEILDRGLKRWRDPAEREILDGRSLRLLERHHAQLRDPDRPATAALIAASRRARRRRQGALTTLVVLALAGLVFGAVQLQRAVVERNRAVAAGDLGFLLRAQLALATDPSRAVAWLRHLSRSGGGAGVRTLLENARRRGVARVLAGHRQLVTSVDFSPDGKTVLTAGRDRTVRRWDRATARALGPPLVGHTNYVTRAVFSPDGELIASASWDRTLRIWHAASGKARGGPLTGHTHWVYDVRFSPDGRTLASAGFDGTVRTWDSATGRPLHTLRGHAKGVMSLAFSPDGRVIVSGGLDTTVRRWDSDTGQTMGDPLRGHKDGIYALAFAPDGGLFASAALDSTVRLWRANDGKQLGPPLRGHSDGVIALAFAPDGRTLASAGEDKVVVLWDLASHRAVGLPLRGHMGFIRALAFAPDGTQIASASRDETVRLWDLRSRKPSGQVLTGHQSWVRVAQFSPNGSRIAAAGRDGTVRLWTVNRRQPLRTLRGHGDAVTGLAFGGDGKQLVTASLDGTVRLWPIDGAPPQVHRSGRPGGLHSLALATRRELLAVGAGDGSVQLLSLRGGQLRPEPTLLPLHSKAVTALAFSPDGRTLASGARDRAVKLTRVDHTDRPPVRLGQHNEAVHAVAFSPDGTLLASGGGDACVRLWQVASARQLGPTLTGHQHWVLGVTFSPDGDTLASAGSDGTVRLWDHRRGRQKGAPLYGHTDWVHGVAFSPNGNTLASAGGDRTVRLWEVAGTSPGDLSRQIDALTNLHISAEGRITVK